MASNLRVAASPMTVAATNVPQPVMGSGVIAANAQSAAPVQVDTREAVQLAIAPKPVLHAPVQYDAQLAEQNLRAALDQINTSLKDGGRGLTFVLDQTVKQPIVQVVRAETGEVIRQIPNEVVVRVAHNLERLKGVLFEGLI